MIFFLIWLTVILSISLSISLITDNSDGKWFSSISYYSGPGVVVNTNVCNAGAQGFQTLMKRNVSSPSTRIYIQYCWEPL